MNSRALLLGVTLMLSTTSFGEQTVVRLCAAGSSRAALSEVAKAFTATSGIEVNATFGASGLLRERIEKGEAADVFASADTGHPLW